MEVGFAETNEGCSQHKQRMFGVGELSYVARKNSGSALNVGSRRPHGVQVGAVCQVHQIDNEGALRILLSAHSNALRNDGIDKPVINAPENGLVTEYLPEVSISRKDCRY